MDMSFGKHKGKQVAWVLIEKPDYFKWLQGQSSSCRELSFALELLAKLDTMPFSSVQCHGNTGCTNAVKYLSLYRNQFNSKY